MKMLLLMIFLMAIMVIAIILIKKRGKQTETDASWPYYEKKPLTQPEQILYHRLVKAMPECIVLAQVQLSRVLGIKKGFNFQEWNNRINRMSLDYIVCLKDSTIIAAIELDDSTHENTSRIKDDEKKNKALSSAGITLIRWHVNSMPNEATIRQTLT